MLLLLFDFFERRLLLELLDFFEVKERPLYNNHGDVVETEFIFYVDEFYEDIVMNLVNGLGMDGSEWSDWFTEKYKL